MESSSKSSAVIVGVVMLVIGGLIGFGITKAADNNNNSSSNNQSMNTSKPSSATKAADLRANLVELGGEHVQLANTALDAAMDGSPYAKAAEASLFKNGNELSAAIGSVYGNGAQVKFQALWNRHLNDFVKYATAAKGGDKAGMASAKADLVSYSGDVATFLSGANPNLPKATVQSLFGKHLNLVIDMINDHVAGNYSKEFTDRETAVNQIKDIDSALANGIVTQYPNKY